ncbi:unnamed protein product [Lactuca virosa]|uniref:Carboxypeptidase n=1 Tax=Lactuca virosa TaxID=75947 RepID=A0AAU9LLL5_9ASTR|nr:unnamed protein product [Lactuca virosa]
MESTLRMLLLFLTLFHHLQPHSSASTLPKEALPTRSGYLLVNSTTGSAIFYAFYEAQNPSDTSLSETPLVIWLQGGPGCSSMTGNFFELGPWRVTASMKQNVEHLSLEPNPGSWNRIFGLLFLDNPIGTGFSIASTPEEIPRDQNAVARHLFIAIRKFLALDPSFKSRPIYITGESYAGKYVPSIGYYILKKNPLLPVSKRINLYGLAIGNGLTHPETQVNTYASHTYYLGLINEKQKTKMEKLQFEVIKLIKAGGIVLTIPSDVVGAALHADVMKSVKYMVEFVVKNTKLLLYQGQCDLRDGVVSVESWVKKMKWEGIGKFLDAEKDVWRVNGVLAGYVQKWDNLSHVVVLGAGHFVPTDQNVNSQAMIEDWVLDKGSFAIKNATSDR